MTGTCLAPVALFAYMRPDHLATTVYSLAANPESSRTHLNVFCDAAKKPEDQAGVDAVHRFADTIQGFASVTVIKRTHNFGLAASIIDGVTSLVNNYDRVIVVEDDLLLSPHFLRYMNEALDMYSDDEKVASIHGYCYPVDRELPNTFFMRGADCWGWATWRRAWAHFCPDGSILLTELEKRCLVRDFDYDGYYGYSRMLRDQIAGRNDSWAIRWHASCYLADLFTLYPGRSLVHNIGNDSSGTHSRATKAFDQILATSPICLERLQIEASELGRAAFIDYFRIIQGNIFLRVLRALVRRVIL